VGRNYDPMRMTHEHPTAIVSWAHTSEGWTNDQATEWRQQVMALVDALRDNGIDADIDLHHAGDVDWTRFGPQAIVDRDWVLVALSPSWKERFEGRNDPTVGAGAAAEANALRSIWSEDQTAFRDKLVLLTLPMVRGERLVPVELHGVQRFTIEDFANEGLEPLLRLLTDQPAYPLRPVGRIPQLAPEARIQDVNTVTSQRVDEVRSAKPNRDQIRVLDAIHDQTLDNGDLPSFRVLDKQLDLEGLKLREIIQSMPPGLIRPDLAVGSYILREDDRLAVTIDGLAYCRGGTDALNLLGRALAYLAERERPFIPSSGGPPLTVTSAEVLRDLALTEDQTSQVRVLIYLYSHQSWTGMSGQDGEWSITVATEYVRRFRGVQDGGEFLRALTGDSFDHRLGGEVVERQLVEDHELQTAAVRLRANIEGLRRRIETALSTREYWSDLLASDVFERYEPALTRRPDVHLLVSDAFLRFHELNQRVPLGEEILPDETLRLTHDALKAANDASTSLTGLADELASALSNADPAVQSIVPKSQYPRQPSERDTSEPDLDVLHEGVPPWMVPRLVRWLEPFLISSDDLGERFPIPEFIESLESSLRLSVPIDRGNVIADVRRRIEDDPNFGINAIRYVLSTLHLVRTPTHQVTSAYLPALERMLEESGSVWEVSELDVEGGVQGTKQAILTRREAPDGKAR
jgi:hypothetical protein